MDINLLRQLERMPVFTLNDYRKVVDTTYARHSLGRHVKEGSVHRIMRDKYTVHKDPFLVAPFIYKPSYVGAYSALHYYGLIAQIPQNIICITTRPPVRRQVFGTDVIFRHSKYLFSYNLEKYGGFRIPVATPEKAFIESIGLVPFSIIGEALGQLDEGRLWDIAKKMPQSTKRRIAYIIYKKWGRRHSVKPDGRAIALDPLSSSGNERPGEYNIIGNVII